MASGYLVENKLLYKLCWYILIYIEMSVEHLKTPQGHAIFVKLGKVAFSILEVNHMFVGQSGGGRTERERETKGLQEKKESEINIVKNNSNKKDNRTCLKGHFLICVRPHALYYIAYRQGLLTRPLWKLPLWPQGVSGGAALKVRPLALRGPWAQRKYYKPKMCVSV